MNKDDYLKKNSNLIKEHKEKLLVLARQYALSNNPVSVGDIVTDHYHVIRVENIGIIVNSYNNLPMCCYYGILQKKSGGDFKNKERGTVTQSNLKKINDKAYDKFEKGLI